MLQGYACCDYLKYEFFFYEVWRTHLPLLEGLTGQVASARSLKQGNVASGLDISVLLQLRQNTCSEEHLQTDHCYEINGNKTNFLTMNISLNS